MPLPQFWEGDERGLQYVANARGARLNGTALVNTVIQAADRTEHAPETSFSVITTAYLEELTAPNRRSARRYS